MDSTRNTDGIREWFEQQVDPAFEVLLARLTASGVAVRWEKADHARTARIQLGNREITYTITIPPDSDPPAGTVLFTAPGAENRAAFSPALNPPSKTPGEMTGADMINDLTAQYTQWHRHHGLLRPRF
jgi:hypothetical protein